MNIISDDINERDELNQEVKIASSNLQEGAEKPSTSSLSIQVPFDDSKEDSSMEPNPPASNPLSLPSLRGRMTHTGQNVICKGMWAMNDTLHGQEGQTSEFEFKLVKAVGEKTTIPVDGRYAGWFSMKQNGTPRSLRIDEKEIDLTFQYVEEESCFMVDGKGVNKFGKFNLKGKMQLDGSVQLFKEYITINLAPSLVKRKSTAEFDKNKRKSVTGTIKREPSQLSENGSSIVPMESESDGAAPVVLNTGRIRKQSSILKESEERLFKPEKVSSKSAEKAKPPVIISEPVESSTANRAQRLSKNLKKCSDLLKELLKHPLSVWFLEPVDHIKLNIPDYPRIVSNPMDFRTIRENIEGGRYDSHHAFAEHMRLVFRNAIAFNQLRENPVHIAAKEISAMFEEKFRRLTLQLEETSFDLSSNGFASMPIERTVSRSSIGGGGKKNRNSSGSIRSFPRSPSTGLSKGGGVRQMVYFPPAIDGSTQQLVEMQRKMEQMQNELLQLRTVVSQNDILQKFQEKADAAHNPLSFEEKRTLVSQLEKLGPQQMEHVLKIVQSALPDNTEETDDFEIPIDVLDTYTLRKLQKFVEENTIAKKKPTVVTSNSISKKSSLDGNKKNGNGMKGAAGGGSLSKKPKKNDFKMQHPGGGGGGGNSSEYFMPTQNNMAIVGDEVDHEAELLFSAEELCHVNSQEDQEDNFSEMDVNVRG